LVNVDKRSTYSLEKLANHDEAKEEKEMPVENHSVKPEARRILSRLHFQFDGQSKCCKQSSQQKELQKKTKNIQRGKRRKRSIIQAIDTLVNNRGLMDLH